jgi:hypothetical protein
MQLVEPASISSGPPSEPEAVGLPPLTKGSLGSHSPTVSYRLILNFEGQTHSAKAISEPIFFSSPLFSFLSQEKKKSFQNS